MAEINVAGKSGRRRLQGPRIDLTPMVDLGFLLITFFMITTTLAKPKTLAINMPSNEYTKTPTVFIDECTVTLVAVKAHKVVYYFGALKDVSQLKIVSIDKVRDVLISKTRAVAALPASFSAEAHKLHVLIKPNADCKYDDLVRLLDEMNINDVQYYAISDVSMEEQDYLKKIF